MFRRCEPFEPLLTSKILFISFHFRRIHTLAGTLGNRARFSTLKVARDTMAGQMPLLLDPAICNWVLLPIVVVMVLVMILRDKVPNLARSDSRCRTLRVGNFDVLRNS